MAIGFGSLKAPMSAKAASIRQSPLSKIPKMPSFSSVMPKNQKRTPIKELNLTKYSKPGKIPKSPKLKILKRTLKKIK